MGEIIVFATRASDQISRIIAAFSSFMTTIFWPSDTGWAKMIVNTVMNNSFLLVGVSLLIIGFVIGLLGRIIRL